VEAIRTRYQRNQAALESLGGKLEALGPMGVLSRGYSVCQRAADGVVVTSSTQVTRGEDVEIMVHRGRIVATTQSTEPPDEEGIA
jgi:exodeoxyribonuclease VII large subunit